MPEVDRFPGGPRARDRKAREDRLAAHLNLLRFRGLRLRSLRWLAVASVPIWLHAHWQIFPDLLAWEAFLAEGFCLSLAATYAGLEHVWARRAANSRLEPTDPMLHVDWSVVDEVRSGNWYAFAVVTLLPWVYVGLGHAVPPPLLSPLTLAACAVTALLAVAEALACRRAPWTAHPRTGDARGLPGLPRLGLSRPRLAGSLPRKDER